MNNYKKNTAKKHTIISSYIKNTLNQSLNNQFKTPP